MLKFELDQSKCTKCGSCIKDCPACIIEMENDYPKIALENEVACYRCQHCFTICPTGAISIFGLKPENSLLISNNLPTPADIELLIKGRRSIRQYKDENLDAAFIDNLLKVAWHAPTGRNCHQVRFTVVADKDKLALLRDEVMTGLSDLYKSGNLPEEFSFFADLIKLWEDKGVDTLFRGAPHFLIASTPATVVSPLQDCAIALSYFELFAQVNGVGTVWDGLANYAISNLVPQVRKTLEIPEDHIIGYAMAFGKPAVSYPRTAQHDNAIIHKISS